MTTTARPSPGQPRARPPRVLLVAGLCVAGAVALITLMAAWTGDRADALGALAGGSLALCFFLFGSLVVDTATRMAPQLAMLMALLTYTLQVGLVALVFFLLTSSGAVGTTLSGGWLAGGVIAATVAWTAGLLVGSMRARIPAYDIVLPQASGGASGASEPDSGAPSRLPEVGAP